MLVIFIEYFYLELIGKEDAAEPNNLEDDEKDDTEADNVEEALDTYDGIDAVIDSFIFNKLSVKSLSSLISVSIQFFSFQ